MPAVLDTEPVSDVRTLNQGANAALYTVMCTTAAGGDPVAASVVGTGPRGAKPTITRNVNTYTIAGLPSFQRLRFAMVHSTGAKGSLPTGNGPAGTVSWVAAAPIASGLVGISVMVDL